MCANKTRKAVTGSELNQISLITAAEEMCPEKTKSTISLPKKIAARRTEDRVGNISSQLPNKKKEFKWLSLALNELADVANQTSCCY